MHLLSNWIQYGHIIISVNQSANQSINQSVSQSENKISPEIICDALSYAHFHWMPNRSYVSHWMNPAYEGALSTRNDIFLLLSFMFSTSIIIIIIIIYLSWSWATCWPVPVSRIQKSLQRSAMIPSASWGIAFHYPG